MPLELRRRVLPMRSLLGAVSTYSADSALYNEFMSQFRANFPDGYMGSNIVFSGTDYTTDLAPDVHNAMITLTVPTIIMGYFGTNSETVTVTSQVTEASTTLNLGTKCGNNIRHRQLLRC